ncbi:MAG: ribbon-helix-helix protein, CopG family [Akkermansia sp.]
MRPIDKENAATVSLQIRFTKKQVEEIDVVAEEHQMSRSEIIRLACSAGVVALKKLGEEGLVKAVAKVLTK